MMELLDWTLPTPRPYKLRTFEELKEYCMDGDTFILTDGALKRMGRAIPYDKDQRKLTYKKYLEHQIRKRKKKWVR